MAIERQNLLVLSTAHIKQDTAGWLDGLGPDRAIDWGNAAGGPYGQVGWFFWCATDNVDPSGDPYPEELWAIFTYARAQGCNYVLFDRDADKIDDLPTWSW